jgi:hypothetical protein
MVRRISRVSCICQYCGRLFSVPASHYLLGEGKFCSKPCRHLADRRTIHLLCETCDRPFTTTPGKQRQNNVRFCSVLCFKTRPLTLEARFWRKVLKTDTCWVWQGMKHKHGYGVILSEGARSPTLLAHRVAWAIGHGPIPEGLDVLHHCDNPPCVNYEQCLFLGTQTDNNIDMWTKERGHWQKNAPNGPNQRSSHVK